MVEAGAPDTVVPRRERRVEAEPAVPAVFGAEWDWLVVVEWLAVAGCAEPGRAPVRAAAATVLATAAPAVMADSRRRPRLRSAPAD